MAKEKKVYSILGDEEMMADYEVCKLCSMELPTQDEREAISWLNKAIKKIQNIADDTWKGHHMYLFLNGVMLMTKEVK